MRLSWLPPAQIQQLREALLAEQKDWHAHFAPDFTAPARPADSAFSQTAKEAEWAQMVEHVARAERVSADIRNRGIEYCNAQYGDSNHAVEIATLIAASTMVGAPVLAHLHKLFTLPVDEHLIYSEFLAMLLEKEMDRVVALELYRNFYLLVCQVESNAPDWADRVAALNDGFASMCVSLGRHDEGHALFRERHKRDRMDLSCALAASRAFLSSGAVARAMQWLNIGAERAQELGRSKMAETLLRKRDVLSKRLS